jgi:hypothetical protein
MPISCYDTKSVIEILMALIMIIAIVAIFLRSYSASKQTITKTTGNTTTVTTGKIGGIGARIIQFACVTLIIPCLVILSFEKVLHGETIATIIGGLIGHVLSGINEYGQNKGDA